MLREFVQIFLTCFVVCCIQANVNTGTLDQIIVEQNHVGRSLDSHVFKESIMRLSSRSDLVKTIPLRDNYIHNLIFAVQQRNLDELERVLHDVSEPSSSNYGRHWSGEQVWALTSNPQARDAIVTYLHANGATVTSETLGGEFISAKATLSVWNKMLNTEFFMFHQRQRNGDIHQLARAHEYSVPKELDSHIHHVINVIELPFVVLSGPTIIHRPSDPIVESEKTRRFHESHASSNNLILPANLRKYYHLEEVYGNELSTQSSCGFNDDYYSPNSLAYFQKNMTSQPLQPALLKGGYVSEDPFLDYAEGNLDIQYIMGVSPRSPTTYWHSNGMTAWLLDVSDTINPPLVLSVSYGAYESLVEEGFHASVTALAMKLGVMGVTLFAATGDDGAVSMDADPCAYNPNFPAVNPYFTAVGATAVSNLSPTTANVDSYSNFHFNCC